MTTDEMDTTWAMVVESDEVYSRAKDRWYPVVSVHHAGGKVKARLTGMAKLVEMDPAKAVRVRRGPTGQAVDMFAVVFSGPARIEKIGAHLKTQPLPDRVEDENDV
jgi:hypothetical protein